MTISFTGYPEDLVMALGSVDETGDWVLQAHPEGVGESLSRGVPFWTVANGNDTRLSLWNPTAEAQDLLLWISYNTETGAEVYKYPIRLEAGQSKTVSFQELIAAQLPDLDGNRIPPEAERGRAVVAAASSIFDPIRVVVSAATLNLQRGTCSWYCIYCAGYLQLFADPSQLFLNAATGESGLLRAKGQHSNGSINNVTWGSTWQSDNTSVAYFAQQQVFGPEAQMISVNPGTGAFSVTQSLQAFSSSYCFYNPTCGQLTRTFSAGGECNVLRLVITQPALPAQDLLISTAPAMPQAIVGARLQGWTGGSLPFDWVYTVTFESDNGTVYGAYSGSTNSTGDSASWTVPFGGQFRGGQVLLNVEVMVSGKMFRIANQPIYNIKGTQPTATQVKGYVDQVMPDIWFAKRIAKHETDRSPTAGGYAQFLPTGFPRHADNHDGCYGIFQLTPPSNFDQYWNWHDNVDAGEELLRTMESGMIGGSVAFLGATGFWNSQVQQWSDWNADNPDVPAPNNTTESDCVFSISPTGSQHTYRDAIWIKMFNGATAHDIVWQNNVPEGQTPFWDFNETNSPGINYVNRICSTTP